VEQSSLHAGWLNGRIVVALLVKNRDGTYASTCALCQEPLVEPVFATSHFIGDVSHDLFRFSDAGMHWDCYAKWPEQPRFAALYFESIVSTVVENDLWPVVHRSPKVLVRYGVMVQELAVLLRATGADLRVPENEWEEWLERRWQEQTRHRLEEGALRDVLSELRRIE
jgi:hypothetical protein